MALGDGNNKGSEKKQYNENTYFSRIRFSNKESKLNLAFSFWKGLLKVSISEEETSYSGVKYNELQYIHLSPMKAKILSDLLKNEVLSNKVTAGINTGMGETQSLITFGYENDLLYCIICKITAEGNIQDSVKFVFNNEYHYDITYKNFEKMDYTRNFRNNAEIEMFINILDEFVKAMTGAISYSVMDMARFDISRINTKLELLMDKMGIERQSSYQANGSSSNSYFNKNGAASSENTNRGRSDHRSSDDIDDLLD